MARWLLGLVLTLVLAAPASAGGRTRLKIGKQYGLPYIQFVIMEDQKLIEKHAKLQGLGDLKVNWATLGGPAQLNDGIISGAIDIAAVGLPNLITMWEKTRTNAKVRAIAGLNFMPLLLLTRDPKIKTLRGLRREGPHRGAVGEDLDAGDPARNGGREGIRRRQLTRSSTRSPSRWDIRTRSRRSTPAAARSRATSPPRRSSTASSRCPATTRWSRPTTSSGRIR